VCEWFTYTRILRGYFSSRTRSTFISRVFVSHIVHAAAWRKHLTSQTHKLGVGLILHYWVCAGLFVFISKSYISLLISAKWIQILSRYYRRARLCTWKRCVCISNCLCRNEWGGWYPSRLLTVYGRTDMGIRKCFSSPVRVSEIWTYQSTWATRSRRRVRVKYCRTRSVSKRAYYGFRTRHAARRRDALNATEKTARCAARCSGENARAE